MQKHETPASAKRSAEPFLRKSGGPEDAYFDLFNRAPVGYFTLDEHGRIREANRTLSSLLGFSPAELAQQPLSQFIVPEDQKLLDRFCPARSDPDAPQACELRLEKKDGTLLWGHLTATFASEAQGAPTGLFVLCDVTAHKRTEQFRGRLYVVLAQVNQAIVHFQKRDELLREICRIAVRFGNFPMAWVGLVDAATGQMKPIAHDGREESFLKSIHVNVNPNSAFSQGPIGQAFLHNQVVASNDTAPSFQPSPWQNEMLKRGYRAMASVPFCLNNAVIGTLNLYADAPYTFSEEELDLLKRIGNTISFALGCHEIEKSRQCAESALRESEAQNRALIHAIPDLIFINRRDGEYLAVHAPDERLLAKPPLSILHRKIGDILPESVAERCLAAIAAALDSHTMQDLTYSIPIEGALRHFEARVAPCTQDTVLTIVRDITERKRAEEALRERETNYFDLFNTVKQAIYIQNLDSTFLNVNQGAVDMYGFDREYIIGKTPEFLAAPGKNDLTRISKLLALAFQGQPQKFEFWGRKKDGTIFPKDVWVVKGKYFGQEVLISVANDITERRQAEAAQRKKKPGRRKA